MKDSRGEDVLESCGWCEPILCKIASSSKMRGATGDLIMVLRQQNAY